MDATLTNKTIAGIMIERLCPTAGIGGIKPLPLKAGTSASCIDYFLVYSNDGNKFKPYTKGIAAINIIVNKTGAE